jgi:MFS family permease
MLLGIGILFCIISGSSMIGELGYPKERPVLTSLFNSSYFIGSIVAAAIALRTVDIPSDWSWRVPSLLQICPSLLQIVFVLLVEYPLSFRNTPQNNLTLSQLPPRKPALAN